MSCSWGFRPTPPPAIGQRRSKYPPHTHSTSSEPTFECQHALVSSKAQQYPRLHLLGLPIEVRNTIWRIIYDDITENPGNDYWEKPSSGYEGLLLTCRQAYFEVSPLWPLSYVPANRIDLFSEPQDFSLVHNFVRVALEIPLNLPAKEVQNIGEAIRVLGSVIQDLRLFFIGKDRFGVQTGLRGDMKDREPLSIDGQRYRERQPIFTSLFYCTMLRCLTLSNCQYPLLQNLLLRHKPHLEYLHISTDPRQQLHNDFSLSEIRGLLVPPKANFPPVKRLHISANAALTSTQVASKVVATLEHLTWIVPDMSFQQGHLGQAWLTETATLLQNLQHATNISTLRIRIDNTIYEEGRTYGDLIYGFTHLLQDIPNLQHFELQVEARSPWLGQEMISGLPDTLTRLFVTDQLIRPKFLEREVVNNYLRPGMKGRYLITKDKYSEFEEDAIIEGDEVSIATTDIGLDWHNADPIIVGEDLSRVDFIPIGKGKLAFVGYEYDARRGEGVKHRMMKLNGRLLDRERNSHLLQVDCSIPSRQKSQPDYLNLYDDGMTPFSEIAHQVSALCLCDESYFGQEEEAQRFFENEKVAKSEELPIYRWMEDVPVNPHDEWMCS